MRYNTLLGLILLLASCSYSIRYRPTYTVQNSSADAKEISTLFIQNIANANNLVKDPLYVKSDTIGYCGKPYHCFKFRFEQKDSFTSIKLDYGGTTIGTRKPTYNELLKNLEDSIKANFNIVSTDIIVTKNR